MSYLRLRPDRRRAAILNAAMRLAETGGYNNLTHDAVAREAGVTRPLVSLYFPGSDLRNEVMRKAVICRVLRVVAQGLLDNHPAALEAPVEVRQLALAASIAAQGAT